MATGQVTQKRKRPMEIRAKKIEIDDRIYSPKNRSGYKVYRTGERGERKVFVPSGARRHGRRLPKKARVYYDGEWREARRSFRMRDGKGRVPVYIFEVSLSW